MQQYEKEYSREWKEVGTLLIYQSSNFCFSSRIIITELDNCIIKNVSMKQIYDTTNEHKVELYEQEFIKKLIKDCQDSCLIILSNQLNKSLLNVDIIKRKLENAVQCVKIPILAIFATQANCFMKPHTGMWRFLKAYIKKYNNLSVYKAVVISDNGGDKLTSVSDVDRAFAWNIEAQFYTISDYLNDKTAPFTWDNSIISPEVRLLYKAELDKMSQPNVFRELGMLNKNGKKEAYVIILMGAPRCGKTKLATYIVNKWRASEFGKKNEIIHLEQNKLTKQALYKSYCTSISNRISVVLDGNYHTSRARTQFISFLRSLPMAIGVLYIDVNVGIEMAKVFNHACVNDAIEENILLYEKNIYNIYHSSFKKPKTSENSAYITYCPKIEIKDSIMQFRY